MTRLRVAHVITRMILGGAQENTLLVCEDLLHRHGDEVLLITGPPRGPEGSLLERAFRRGVPVKIVPELHRAIHPWRDWVAGRELKQVLREFRPDVVHTHSAKGGILGRRAAWSLGIPCVIHGVHGAPFHPYQNPLARAFGRWMEWWAAGRCHAFVSVADAMTDLMVSGRVARRERFTTIYSGMEVEPFLDCDRHRDRIRAELGFNPEDVVVGKVARLFDLKGHDDLIRAAGRVASQAPNVKYLFVGDGSLRAHLEALARREGVAERIRFAGLVPSERMPEMFAAIDLVAHCSLREGLARVLPQGLLSGRPVISYDIDGAREVVLDRLTGRLLSPRDVPALAAAIVELAGDAELRRRLADEGRRRCREVFRHEFMTERTRALYLRILAGSAAPARIVAPGGAE
jgi:glycosyltransferase involved in cell wall biosynthesis